MYQAIVFLCGALIAALVLLLFRKKENMRRNALKILTLVFCAVGFFRFFLSDAILFAINGGWYEGVRYEQTDILQIILRWGYFTNYSVLPVAVFCGGRFFKNVAGYFSLPFTVLSTVFFNDYMAYFLDPKGEGYHVAPTFRYVYFILELALAVAIPIILHIGEKHIFNFKSGREWGRYLLGLPGVILATMPAYAPQSFFGTDMKMPDWFKSYHLIWIGVTILALIILYYVFRFRTYEERYMLCLFLVLVLFFHYNSQYLKGLTLSRLPFDLCNLASYLYLVAFVLKSKKIFHFCFIANTVGTLFAIIAPNFGIGHSGFWNVHFLIQHSWVLIIPILLMALRIFPRFTKESIGYFFVGFTIYITFCYVLGIIINGELNGTDKPIVNWFYMFNFKIAFEEYFSFLKFVENYYFVFGDGRFVVYPLVYVIVYVGFSALSMLFFLLARLFYRFEDDWLEQRVSAIDLYEKITKKKTNLTRYYID